MDQRSSQNCTDCYKVDEITEIVSEMPRGIYPSQEPQPQYTAHHMALYMVAKSIDFLLTFLHAPS